MKIVRVYQTGGPEVLRLEDTDVPQPGPGPGTGPHRGHRRQLHRDLPAHRPLQHAHALHAGHRGGGHGRGGRARRHGRPAGRPGRLGQRARGLHGVCARARGAPGAAARWRDHPAGRRGAPAGNDGALSHQVDLSAQPRPDLSRPRGGGRRRTAALPDGEAPRRPRDRHRLHRGQGRARAPGRRRRRHPLHPGRLRERDQTAHRRRRRPRGLRLGRTHHLRQGPQLHRCPGA